MGKVLERLREHLSSASKEQLDKEYEELKEWNDIGPYVEEYIDERTVSNCNIVEDMCKSLHLNDAATKNAMFLIAERKDSDMYEFLEQERKKYKYMLDSSPVQDEDYRLGCLNTVEHIMYAWKNCRHTIISDEGSVLEINPGLSGAASHGE